MASSLTRDQVVCDWLRSISLSVYEGCAAYGVHTSHTRMHAHTHAHVYSDLHARTDHTRPHARTHAHVLTLCTTATARGTLCFSTTRAVLTLVMWTPRPLPPMCPSAASSPRPRSVCVRACVCMCLDCLSLVLTHSRARPLRRECRRSSCVRGVRSCVHLFLHFPL